MGKRSGGCITCRKRKVKCDESKPTCVRCSKATYTCQGYDQPWLDETPYIELARKRAAEREEEYRESWNALLPFQALQSEGFLPVDRVARSLNLSAFQEDICRSFVLHRLSAGSDISKAMSWWLSPRPKVEVQSRTLVSASKAISAAFFGRIHQQAKIVLEGDPMYGEALRNLSKDLSHPVKAFTFETLGATMALTMYELVNMGSGTTNWISHAGGIGKLIQVRGPDLHQTYPERSLFLESRMPFVANAIFSCQGIFLDDPKWKIIPWQNDPMAKTPFDYFVDALSDIPHFLQQVPHGPYTPIGIHTGVQSDKAILQKQLLDCLETMKSLRDTWSIKYSDPLWQIPPRTVPPVNAVAQDNVEPPFQTVFYFTDMHRAYDFCIYNTTLILLIMKYEQVSHDIDPSLPYPSITLQTLFPKTSVHSLVQDICRCTEYLLLDIHGSRGYIVLMFPATIAYFASEKDSLEAKWLYNVCKQRAGSSGFGCGDFALDHEMPLTQWMDHCKKTLSADSLNIV